MRVVISIANGRHNYGFRNNNISFSRGHVFFIRRDIYKVQRISVFISCLRSGDLSHNLVCELTGRLRRSMKEIGVHWARPGRRSELGFSNPAIQ